MAQQSDCIEPDEFKRGLERIISGTSTWRPAPACCKPRCLFVLKEIGAKLQSRQVSFGGLQNLAELACLIFIMLKNQPESTDPVVAKTLFTTATLFINHIARIPHPEEEQRNELKRIQQCLVRSVGDAHRLQPSGIPPTFALDWFDKIPEDIALDTGFLALDLFRSLLEMNLSKVSLQHAAAQIARTVSFLVRSIPKMGYDIQAAFYLRGLKAVSGKGVIPIEAVTKEPFPHYSTNPDFVFMVQETEAPYMVYFVGLPPAYLEVGAAKVQIAIDRWTACMERNEWPGYEKRIMWADCPAWALAEIEEKMITQETWNELAFRFGKVAPKERYNK